MLYRLFFIFALIPFVGYAQEPIAQNIVSIGDVKAEEKQTRPLKRGDSVYILDTIEVGASSKAQFRFTDGGVLNLIASTSYRIDSYAFKQPNQASQYTGTLITGGFRAISGEIGKDNPKGTTVNTPVAVIGLRGTTYEAILVNGNLYAGCDEGTVSISNEFGELEIGPHSPSRYAVVMKGKKPQPLNEKPNELAISFEVEGSPAIESPQSQPQPALQENEQVAGNMICPGEGQGFGAGQGQGAGFGQGFGAGEGQGVVYDSEGNAYPTQAIPYGSNEGPYAAAYEGSSSTSYLAPSVALGTLGIAGVIAIVSQCTHHHSSSSYYRHYSSYSYSHSHSHSH